MTNKEKHYPLAPIILAYWILCFAMHEIYTVAEIVMGIALGTTWLAWMYVATLWAMRRTSFKREIVAAGPFEAVMKVAGTEFVRAGQAMTYDLQSGGVKPLTVETDRIAGVVIDPAESGDGTGLTSVRIVQEWTVCLHCNHYTPPYEQFCRTCGGYP